ncbi:hypothetical protein V6N13_068344 [Hibiscus sabdariffa]
MEELGDKLGFKKGELGIEIEEAGSTKLNQLKILNLPIMKTGNNAVEWASALRCEGWKSRADEETWICATGLSLKGDLDVHYVFSASLPNSHQSFYPQKHLERFSKWKEIFEAQRQPK